MNILRFSAYSQFSQIQEKCREIGKCSTNALPSKFIQLLKVLFPSEKLSPLAAIYEQGVNSSKNKWIGKIKAIISILSCKSSFGQALLLNRDLRIDLNILCLGNQLEQFLRSKTATQGLNSKKQMNTISIPILECFLIKLVNELVNLKQYQKRSSWKQSFQLDQFYFHILRNPIMHLLRDWLIYARTIPFVFNRIINVLEYLVIRQPISRFRRNESITIRTHHFYAIYLLIQWKTTSNVWQFLSFIVEYLQSKQKNFNLIFICWIRLHLVLLKRGSEYELNLRKDLEEGLNKQTLSMTRISSQSEDDMETLSGEIGEIKDYNYLQNFSYQIESLLNKEYYQATPQLLSTILSIIFMFRGFALFEKSLLSAQIGKAISKFYTSSKRKQPEMDQIVMLVMKIYKRSGGEYSFNQEDELIMKEESKISMLREKGSGAASTSRRSFVTYQREVNPWQAPITQSQSHLFYGLSQSLSRRIDQWLGKQPKKYPTTNLRFLSSFKNLSFIFAIFLMIIFYYP